MTFIAFPIPLELRAAECALCPSVAEVLVLAHGEVTIHPVSVCFDCAGVVRRGIAARRLRAIGPVEL